MKFNLYIDECGDQNLSNFNPKFPIFTLCGIIINIEEYENLRNHINSVKRKYWNDKKIIFHSRDIRKHQNGFEILFNMDVKKELYEDINKIVSENQYSIIACSILKEPFIKKYGRMENVYGISLSFIMERLIFYIDFLKKKRDYNNIEVNIIAEKRGKKEDNELLKYYNKILDKGTFYINSKRMKNCFKGLQFKWKRENINGLQLADLIAYPISRFVLDSDEVNYPFEILRNKLYQEGDKLYGLKVFPK